jgi:hypothetical protein
VQQTERSRRCALSPSNELVDFGCQHRTVSIVWTTQTSRAQDSTAIYLPGCISLWNPSKHPRRFSLGDPYLSLFVLLFFVFHTKNHATYFQSKKLHLNYYIERSSFHCASYLRVNWFRCEPALEEAASVDGAGGIGASSWEAPKDTSSSLLEELSATIRERRAVVFVLRIYTIVYE